MTSAYSRYNQFRVRANAICLIRSLPSGDEGVARRLAEDLAVVSEQNSSLPIEHHSVESFSDLLMLFSSFEARARSGFRPVLHFDMHASRFGLEFRDGSLVNWEKFIERLIRLNGAVRMNLMISLAVCEGAAAILGLRGLTRAPFALLLAPRAPITAVAAQEWTRKLYVSILENRDLSSSLRSANASVDVLSEFEPYTFAELFGLGYEGYVTEHCHRAVIRSRAARILRGLRRSGIGVAVGGHPLSMTVERLRGIEASAERIWRRFAWHDLGGDVASRTPWMGWSVEGARRLPRGKSIRRRIRVKRMADPIYGRLVEYVHEVHADPERVFF